MVNVDGSLTRDLFGVPVNMATMSQVLSRAEECIAARTSLHLGMVNAAKLVNMRSDALLRDSVLASDMILADGMSVVWASRLLGRRLPERVAGVDLMFELLRVGSEKGYRFYCLGATEEVVAEVVRRIGERYPGAVVAGYRNGYFKETDEAGIIEAINASEADVLFVAMSPPKKEQFLARWAETLRVPVCHGVGGSFDVFAGKVKRAPEIWQKLGMEWMYRVVQEPRRMWRRYLVTNTRFLWMVLVAMLGFGGGDDGRRGVRAV